MWTRCGRITGYFLHIVSATLQAKNGNWGGAALSAISILPFGDAAKVFKVGDDFKVISNAISVIQRNRIIGKMAESQITKKLAARFGKEAQIGEQITARFSDGTKIVFDNVVVKEGKILYIGETKSGKAVLTDQQKRFF